MHSKTFLGLPVRTEGGSNLGRVSGFELDTGTGRLTSIVVRTRGVVPGLLDQELSIAWSQVIEITEQDVIVKDAVVRAGANSFAVRAAPSAGNAGVSASERTA